MTRHKQAGPEKLSNFDRDSREQFSREYCQSRPYLKAMGELLGGFFPPPILGSDRIVDARPTQFHFDLTRTALLSIDWQRDFLEPGGYGEALGNDVSLLRDAIEPARRVLEAARRAGLLIIHTREGHLPDLSDCPKTKLERWPRGKRIGDTGPMGRILIRGESEHEIIEELKSLEGEIIVDKHGKNAFLRTALEQLLREREIESLIEIGVTTDICGVTTLAGANDLGFDVLAVSDAMASYDPARHAAILDVIIAQGGILGWVTDSNELLKVLA